ncbi:MAG: LysR family transcriptional regulator [Silvibacterium sp.]
MDANLTQIRAFLTVARVKGFTQAAPLLHLSQPALTVQIRQLETSLGVRLFDRNTRHVALTSAGRDLVPKFQRLLLEFESVVTEARESSTKRQGIVRLGCLPSFAATYLPGVIAAFRKNNPLISFVLRDANGKRIIDMIRTGEVEFGITDSEPKWQDLEVTELYQDQMQVVFSKSHPIAKLKRITINDVVRWPMVLLDNETNTRSFLDAAFEGMGMLITPVCEVSYTSSAIGMVRAGLGISLLGSLTVKSNNLPSTSDLRFRPIYDPNFVRHLGMAWKAKQSLSPASEAFTRLLLEFGKKDGWLESV